MELFGFIITIERADAPCLTRRSIRKALVKYAREMHLLPDLSSKIALIKRHRIICPCDLKASKEAIEKMFGYNIENLYK